MTTPLLHQQAIFQRCASTHARCVQRPTRDGSDDVQAAGRSVSTVVSGSELNSKHARAVAKPCKIEKDDTEAVIDAKLLSAGVPKSSRQHIRRRGQFGRAEMPDGDHRCQDQAPLGQLSEEDGKGRAKDDGEFSLGSAL